jgi:Swt1-like HEPN
MTLPRGAEVQAFLFRAATTNGRIDEMISDGELLGVRPAPSSDSGTVAQFSIAVRTAARRMARVYELLFCFENSVRELIEDRLKEAYGVEKWWADGVPEDIAGQAERLKAKEKQTPWHGPRGGTLLAFVDFPVLARIITERWEQFEDLLGKPAWVESVFDEVNQSRRAIAHTGVLSQHDAERMELRVRDWLRSVG